MEPKYLLLWVSQTAQGNWPKMYEMVKNKVRPEISAEEVEEQGKKFEEKFTTFIDDDYPSILKTFTDGTVPFVLYYKGDISLAKSLKKKLAVIGSRKNSKYGEKTTREIVSNLPEDIIIVSGLARGIDTVAIRAALDTNKKVIAVIGNSIDSYYPTENEALFKEIESKGGLILSEYPPKAPINPDNFRWRNRIVAGLCDLVLIGESYDRSGCSITVSYALNFGKSVCCVPYPAGLNSFCNTLIKEGAVLVENASEVDDLLRN